MTAFDYARSRATAEKLIAKFGMAGTLIRQTNSGPANDPIVTDTPYPCTLVVLDYEDGKVDGTLIRRTDKMIYLSTSGLSITPGDADRIMAGAESFSIITIKPLAPAGITLFYEIQARR